MSRCSLNFISLMDRLLGDQSIPYWVFGGWTTDFYIGNVRREHGDVDILIWEHDAQRVRKLFTQNGFREEPLYHRDEHTRFSWEENQVDVIYIVQKENGDVVTPGRWIDWPYPKNTFHLIRYTIGDTTASVVHPDCMLDTYENCNANSADAKLKAKHHQDFLDLKEYLQSTTQR